MKQREIKFRGFDAKQNKWLYGGLITKIDPQHAEDTFWCYLIHDGALSAEVVAAESIGQFTGLLDKNGKEIFESDVVNFARKERICKNEKCEHKLEFKSDQFCPSCGEKTSSEDFITIAEIKFSKGGFALAYTERGYDWIWQTFISENYIEWIEVVGNIYQNADLLK